MLVRFLSVVLFIISMPVEALQQEKGTYTAHTAYKLAVKKIINQRAPLLDGQLISFEEIIEAQSGDSQSVTKTLHLDLAGIEYVENISDISTDDNGAGLNWQSNILVDPSRYPENPQLIAETENTWVFSIPTQINADTSDVGQDVDSAKVNNVLLSSLVSELTISKSSPHFVSQKIYATHPFKPDNLVKVNEFMVKIDFGQAWQGGPWVTESIYRVLKGSYAFFVSVEEFSVTRYQNFEVINKSAEQ